MTIFRRFSCKQVSMQILKITEAICDCLYFSIPFFFFFLLFLCQFTVGQQFVRLITFIFFIRVILN